MEPTVEGFASPQGVAPIGFELQNMEEGVAPGSQPLPPPPPDQSSLYPSANVNANSDANGLGNQDMRDAEKGAASASPARSGDEITEESADDIRLLPDRSQGGDRSESQEDKTLFFKDGERRIDFVFAYKHQDTVDEKKKTRREVFENNLRKSGLNLEQETVEYDKDDSIVYVKVHAPWKVLTAQAEIMNMKMPLAVNDMVESIGSCWEKCPSPFDYDADILPPIPDYFTAAFSRERENQAGSFQDDHRVGRAQWFIIENKDTFFSTAQRSLLVYQILQRCVFEEHEERGKSKFGIKKMVSNGCYDAAYPLHEGEFTSEHSLLTRGKANNRHLLYETWARPGAWYKFQPLDHIRKYFGEKVGIYFSWLGFYTGQLIPAAIVGLVVFFYGVGTFASDPTSGEICNKTGPGASIMCPLCDGRCPYWYLWKSCVYSTVTYLFDNEATVFFAGFMALWAEFFIEMWKRRTAEIEYDWDVADFEEEETVRPEFEASVKKRRTNPINKTEEPYLDLCSRIMRYVSSLWVVIFMLCIVLAAVFAVIVYRMTVSALLFAVDQEEISQWSSTITSITAAVINLICIIFLGRIYLILARILTDFETHRTQTEWEDSFTLKMFLFQFVNHYSSLFYIAFFKGKFIGRPGDYNREINSERQEECDPSGCLIELLIQLMIIMVGKQTFNNFKEIIIPKLMNWFKSRRVKEEGQKECKKVAVWERDYNMATMPDLGLFDEYLEMVLQYGFVTIFVAAFPLAPLFALINNIIEIRLDAYKFVTQWRRPLAARAQDIGIWFGILRGITTIAVASNAAIIAFTSDFIPKLVYRYGYDNDGRIEGYVLFSLSVFNVKDFDNRSIPVSPKIDNVTQCHYRDFREGPPDYKLSMEYWHVLTAKLAFVIVFILVVVFLQWLVSFLITDVPRTVKMQMLREKYLAKESILAAEVLRRDRLGGGSNTNLTRRSPAASRAHQGSLVPDQPLY